MKIRSTAFSCLLVNLLIVAGCKESSTDTIVSADCFNCRVDSIHSGYPDNIGFREVYQYDGAGKLTSKRQYDPDELEIEHTVFYNSENKPMYIWQNKVGDRADTFATFEFNDELLAKVKFTPSGSGVTYRYAYDQAGNFIGLSMWSENGFLQRRTYTFYASGCLESMTTYLTQDMSTHPDSVIYWKYADCTPETEKLIYYQDPVGMMLAGSEAGCFIPYVPVEEYYVQRGDTFDLRSEGPDFDNEYSELNTCRYLDYHVSSGWERNYFYSCE